VGEIITVVALGLSPFGERVHVIDQNDFDPTVLPTQRRVGIVGNRPRRACALEIHAVTADALLGQNPGHGAGALFG